MPLIRRAASTLRSLGASEVYLFGSMASGQCHEDSDVDLAVTGLPPGIFYDAMGQVCDILGRPVDMVSLDDDVPFTRYLKTKGHMLRVA